MTVLRKMRTDEVALRKARMLIGGNWVDSASGEVLEVEDPAHRRPIAEVPRGGAEDCRARSASRGRCLSRLVAHDSPRAWAPSRADCRCA
jgi:hypothetical protein